MLEKIEGKRRRGQQRMRWLESPTQWTWIWASSGKCRGWGILACCNPWGLTVRHGLVTEQQQHGFWNNLQHISSCTILIHVLIIQFLMTRYKLFITPKFLSRGCVHAQLLQSCPTLCDPVDCSLPGSSVHRILQGKNTAVGWCALLQGIFPSQELNVWHLLHLLYCRQILYHWDTRKTQASLRVH